jgi:hypothetical protein
MRGKGGGMRDQEEARSQKPEAGMNSWPVFFLLLASDSWLLASLTDKE